MHCRKIITSTVLASLLAASTLFALPNTSQAASKVVSLPKSNITENFSLVQALSQRKSSRQYVDKALTKAQLSNILWAANGINRQNQKGRVNPTALGVYFVDVYAVTKDGIYLYEPTSHSLTLIESGDYRMATTMGQDFVGTAALNLVYVEVPDAWNGKSRVPDNEHLRDYANIAIGAMCQSAALAAEAEGLGNCVRGSVDREKFAKAAHIKESQRVLLAQTFGVIK